MLCECDTYWRNRSFLYFYLQIYKLSLCKQANLQTKLSCISGLGFNWHQDDPYNLGTPSDNFGLAVSFLPHSSYEGPNPQHLLCWSLLGQQREEQQNIFCQFFKNHSRPQIVRQSPCCSETEDAVIDRWDKRLQWMKTQGWVRCLTPFIVLPTVCLFNN